MKDQNQRQIQNDIQDGGQHQKIKWRFGISHGADDAGGGIIKEGKRDPQTDNEKIVISILKNICRGVHRFQNHPAQGGGQQRQNEGQDNGQPGGVGGKFPHFPEILRSEPLSYRYGKPAAGAGGEPDNQKVQRVGGSNGSQCLQT